MDEAELVKGEKIVLKAQGTIQAGSTWKPGHLLLTDRRLIFVQVGEKIFEGSLDKITGLGITRRNWMLGVKVRQLWMEFDCGSGRMHAYVALAKPGVWVDAIKDGMALMLYNSRGTCNDSHPFDMAERRGCNGTEPESPGNA
jgi:hypothetical protein